MSRRRSTRRDGDDGSRGRGAVPADDLAVAGLSGRRLLLFQRHRMGGGSRRHHRRRLLAGLARRRCSRTAAAFATACFWPTRTAPPSSRDDAALARDRRARRRLRAVARAPARNLGAGPRLHRDRARGLELRRARSDDRGLRRRRSSIPSRSASSAPRTTIPLAPTLHAFFHALTSNWISAGARLIPLGQTDSQRVLAQLEPVVVATAKRALPPRSTISAARPSAPISPACGTRRSIRGCSGHEARPSTRRPGERRDP